MNRLGPKRSAFSSGSALALARHAAGITQKQLAERACVSSFTISALETGRTKQPLLRVAAPVALALGLTIADLWPTLASALKRGRLLDTVIAMEEAVKRAATPGQKLRLVYSDPHDGHRVKHVHRPPICCGGVWCRCVDLSKPETYPIFGDPKLIEIAAGGVNG